MLEIGGSVPQVDIEMLFRLLVDARRQMDPRERDRMASLLASIVNSRVPRAAPESSPMIDGASARLSAEGLCAIKELLRPEKVAAVAAYFRSRPCFNAHVHAESDGVPRHLGEGAEAFHYGCYALSDVIGAPHLIELANDTQLIAIAERYLGCTPTLYSLNAWWSFPGLGQRARVSQSFHRDIDDFRFCTLFVYLTDVDERGGPHVYVRRTHRANLLSREIPGVQDAMLCGEGYGLDDAINRSLGHLIETVLGSAGDGLIADTHGFHMGLPPERERLIFWARYGLHASVGPSSAPVERETVARRIPWSERAAYINRTLVRG